MATQCKMSSGRFYTPPSPPQLWLVKAYTAAVAPNTAVTAAIAATAVPEKTSKCTVLLSGPLHHFLLPDDGR